jgi:hypothetical protein
MTSSALCERAPAWRRLARRVHDYWPDAAAFAGALLWAALAALLTAPIGGCGGGVGTEGTGTFASGPISGFGSIVVNGVHYDTGNAMIEDDDGQAAAASVLQLGTMVQINAGAVTVDGDGISNATATSVRYVRALVGPVAAIDLAASRLTVLGQPVAVSAGTVFGDGLPAGLAGIAPGQAVEVYGDFDSGSGAYEATRIALAPSGSGFLARGPVSALDAAAQTFRIGGQTYSYAALASTSGLAEGAVVKLMLPATQDDKGHWVVAGEHPSDDPAPANASVDLRGTVDRITSPTRFVVDGRSVDAASARIDAGLRVGASVHVTGTLVAGVLVANRVEVAASAQPQSFELMGPITALDTVARRFVVRATTVSYADAGVVFERGSAADLAPGRMVRVEGVLGSDGHSLRATTIRFMMN